MPGRIAKHSADIIYGRGVLTAEAIADELRTRLINRLVHHYNRLTPEQLLALARETLEQFEPILARTMIDAQLAAWVRGLEVITNRTPKLILDAIAAMPRSGLVIAEPLFPVDSVTFPALEKAVNKLLEKSIVTRDEFDALQAAARDNAFTVSGLQTESAIEKVREAVARQVQTGGTLRDFRQDVAESIGRSDLAPHHIENIYRTNVQRAFAEGQETIQSHPVVHAAFPYARYDAIHDGRVRENHLALETLGLNGTNVYRVDDPMWSYFTPPHDFSCRCAKTFLTVKQAAKLGVLEAKRWDRTGEPPSNPEWRIDHIPFRPEDGFICPRPARAA